MSLLNRVSLRLRALPVIDTCLRAFTLVNKRLTRFSLVLLQIPLSVGPHAKKV